MKWVVRLVVVALGVVLFSGSVFAEYRSDNHGVIRVHIPVHVHGAKRLPIARMIVRQRRMNLDNYVLRAVVVQGSHGHTRLTVGRYSSPTVHLNHNKVRIDAPARYGDHWRLHVGPDTEVTAVTAILEPRTLHAHRGYTQPGFDLGWLRGRRDSDHGYRDNGGRNHHDLHEPSGFAQNGRVMPRRGVTRNSPTRGGRPGVHRDG